MRPIKGFRARATPEGSGDGRHRLTLSVGNPPPNSPKPFGSVESASRRRPILGARRGDPDATYHPKGNGKPNKPTNPHKPPGATAGKDASVKPPAYSDRKEVSGKPPGGKRDAPAIPHKQPEDRNKKSGTVKSPEYPDTKCESGRPPEGTQDDPAKPRKSPGDTTKKSDSV